MVSMAGMEDHERKIVIEFCHLLEKSKQLFNGLRYTTPAFFLPRPRAPFLFYLSRDYFASPIP